MGKLVDLPTTRVLAALRRVGWEVHAGGKHYKLLHSTLPGALTVPRAHRLKKGTLRAIIRQAGLTLDRFWDIYE